jgi:hypothetical protein
MPLKSVRYGQMTDLHSVVVSFRKPSWTELAITHEINRVLGSNTISYPTVGKYVRMCVLSTTETNIPFVPESERNFNLDGRIALVLSEHLFFQFSKLFRR